MQVVELSSDDGLDDGADADSTPAADADANRTYDSDDFFTSSEDDVVVRLFACSLLAPNPSPPFPFS